MLEKKDRLIKIVGKAYVLDDFTTLDGYSKDHSFIPPRAPGLVVRPENVAEVQQIVKWANQNGVNLVPVSSGPPHFRGDTIPSVGSAVVVDLGRMRHIKSIDRRNRIAVIEPGVTYNKLQKALAREGLRISTPLLPRRNKSVVASLLEREPTLIPKYQWSLMEPLRCLEVIWGDGSKMWTGEAGQYDSQDIHEQQRKHRSLVVGMGPDNVDYYRLISASQGTMGIITWASIKCDVLPHLHRLFFIPAEKLDDLIECTYRILKFRYGDELLILNRTNLAAILGKNTEEIEALREIIPQWVLLVGIAGRDFLPQERVAFQEKDIADIVHQCGLKMATSIPGVRDNTVLETLLTPSGEPYWKLNSRGDCHDIFFLTTLNRTPEFLRTMYSIAETTDYPTSDIGVYLQPQHQGVSCHCEFNLPFNPNDHKDVMRVQELYIRTSEALLAQGAFYSRPYGIWSEMVFNKDETSTMLLKKVKKLFDPNNVLNRGKLCF